jgi:hypothetical protein
VSETDIDKQNDSKNLPDEAGGAVRDASDIPRFDLAEQILAEQRKVTSIRRKAPGKSQRLSWQDGDVGKESESSEKRPGAESTGYTIKHPPALLSEGEQIIAEIVSRDIERLLKAGRDEFPSNAGIS